MRKKSPRLVLVNETRYASRDLRSFFLAGMRAMGVKTSKHVRVSYSHKSMQWGCASLGTIRLLTTTEKYMRLEGQYVHMTLPPPDRLDLRDFARTFEHELLHNLGVSHGDMTEAQRYCRGDLPAWAQERTLRETAPKPTVSAVVLRETRARAHLAKHETALAREQKLVRKWREKVAYYDRRERLAAKEKESLE